MFRQMLLKKTQRFGAALTRRLFASESSAAQRKAAAPLENAVNQPSQASLNHVDIPIVDFDEPGHMQIPIYQPSPNETLKVRKQRLIYQSRKRGMLENDLLLSTFVHKYLEEMTEDQVALYDELINGVTNDWDIYYWATETKPTPPEYDNEIMQMLKMHVKNSKMEARVQQPELY